MKEAVCLRTKNSNLRNRVSYTAIKDLDNADQTIFNAATYYTYDIHGNVDTLLQDYKTGSMNSSVTHPGAGVSSKRKAVRRRNEAWVSGVDFLCRAVTTAPINFTVWFYTAQ
jgi:hypothetical protein